MLQVFPQVVDIAVVSVIAVVLLKPIKIKRERFSFIHAIEVIKTPQVIFCSVLAIMMQFYMQGTVFALCSARSSISFSGTPI